MAFVMGYLSAVFYLLYSMLVLCSTVVFVRETKDEVSSTKAPELPDVAPAAPMNEEATHAAP